MDLSSGDISSMIFKRAVRDDLEDFSLNRQTLLVFMELDGKATLGALARKSGLNMATMRELISDLWRLGLIENVEKEVIPADSDFFSYLVEQLSLATGPIAEVLIEDEVDSFGYDPSRFPTFQTMELVNKLAAEIRREEKRSVFVKNMEQKIREKGYVTS